MRRAITTHAGRERSERGAQVVDRQPAITAVHDVEGAAEQRSDRQHTAHRQSPHGPNNGGSGACSTRWRTERRWSGNDGIAGGGDGGREPIAELAGQLRLNYEGSQPTGAGNGRCASRRTKSFSVVTSAAAPMPGSLEQARFVAP